VTVRGAAAGPLAAAPAGFGDNILLSSIGPQSALIADTFASGPAGQFVILGDAVSVLDGGLIRANTSSSGKGGVIVICPDGTLLVSGVGSALLANSSGGSTGDAGSIGVQADKVQLANGGRITVASAGAGQGGQVLVQAHDFAMSNAGGSSAPGEATAINTLVSGAAGAASVQGAGQVAILAGAMSIDAGSVVTTDTTGAAPAGRIIIRAGDLSVSGATTVVSSASQGVNPGDAGVIDIAARNLNINDAKISTLSDNGSGGQVYLSVDNQLLLVRGEITTAVKGTKTDSNAGNISIGLRFATPVLNNPCQGYCATFDPFALVPGPVPTDGIPDKFVNDGGSIVGSAVQGRGGLVTVVAENLINSGVIQSDPDSGIDVTSVAGIDGSTSVAGTAFVLPNFVIAPDNDFRSMCELQSSGVESQFVAELGAQPYDPTALRFESYMAPPTQTAAAHTVEACATGAVSRPKKQAQPFRFAWRKEH